MNFEIGKIYNTRDGERVCLVEIIKDNGSLYFEMCDKPRVALRTHANGMMSDDGTESPWDVIAPN